jgi:L-asparaginase
MDHLVRILAAGGTFDKHYNPLDGSLGFGQSQIPALLQDARLNQAPLFDIVMQIDSLDMTQAHREQVLQRVLSAAESRIIVIHGTDTMVETAQVLGKALGQTTQQHNKTVVLTGAMVPYTIAHSDATFNLGFALAAAQTLGQGVYIAMGGQVFDWDKVKKNRALGRFEAIQLNR